MSPPNVATIFVALTLCLFLPAEAQYQAHNSNLSPESPPLDSLLAVCAISGDSLIRIERNDTLKSDYYQYRDSAFSGCGCFLFENDIHRYRFILVQDGYLVRQVGFYENGFLDHDFNMKEGISHGRERMWYPDGTIYIDNNYIEGVPHGYQLRQYPTSIPAREALYREGKMVYEWLFNKEGTLVEIHGLPPE